MPYATIHKNILESYFNGQTNADYFINLSPDILKEHLILYECCYEIIPRHINHFLKSYFEKSLYDSRKQMRIIYESR